MGIAVNVRRVFRALCRSTTHTLAHANDETAFENEKYSQQQFALSEESLRHVPNEQLVLNGQWMPIFELLSVSNGQVPVANNLLQPIEEIGFQNKETLAENAGDKVEIFLNRNDRDVIHDLMNDVPLQENTVEEAGLLPSDSVDSDEDVVFDDEIPQPKKFRLEAFVNLENDRFSGDLPFSETMSSSKT